MTVLLVILALALLAILVLLYHYGAFYSVTVEEREIGPFHLAYKENVGDYRSTGKIVPEVEEALAQRDVSGTERFAIYFDDPKTTPKEELRSQAGCIIQPAHAPVVEVLGEGLEFRELPRQKAMVSRFPFKGFLSVFMGFFKVDPVIKSHREKKGYRQSPVMVIYGDNELTYVAPIVS